jgi:glycosyltransferase involved in cell wall biosynthesis
MSPEKGHADLIDAIGIVSGRGHRVSAVLIGDGPERPSLLQQVRTLGLEASVYFPGYINQPERIFEDIDLLVLPSHTEGLPNAALEALAMGVPVLATRVGGTPEVIIDGETGRLVAPRSPEALADSIIEFLANPEPWKRMAIQGRNVVETHFNFQARTRKLEAIYAELVGGA